MEPLRFYVNGKSVTVLNADPRSSLADYLRSDTVRLMGTKVSDQEGLTGTDTVAVIDWVRDSEGKEGYRLRPLLASLFPLVSCHGKAVITVEGLGNLNKMHPIQKQFAQCNPTQCGYCEGGFIMSLYTLLRNKNGKVVCSDIEEAFDGNICRCTGYAPIAAASAAFASDAPEEMLKRWDVTKEVFEPEKEAAYPKLFPGTLEHTFRYVVPSSGEIGYTTRFFAPGTLDECLRLLREHPSADVVNGNTHGLVFRPSKVLESVVVSLQAVKELNVLTVRDDLVELGASRTIAELQGAIDSLQKFPSLAAAGKQLRFILSTQRRNQATIGGELAYGAAEPEVGLLLAALGARVKYCAADAGCGVEECGVEDLASRPVRLILGVSFVPSAALDVFFFREAQRKVNFPVYFAGAVTATNFFVGGLTGRGAEFSRVTARPDVAALLFGEQGKALSACALAKSAVELLGVPECDRYSKFRRYSLMGWVEKALYYFGRCALSAEQREQVVLSPPRNLGLPVTTRHWPEAVTAKVGHNTKLLSARVSATGGSIFTNDLSAAGMLYAALVVANKPGYKITGFDTSEAEQVVGFVHFVTAKDIPGKNLHSGIPPVDTKVFQDDVCLHYNEPCGLVVAESDKLARLAASKVKVLYGAEKVKEVYPDIKSAMAGNSYHPHCDVGALVLVGGDVEKGMREAEHTYETECFMGGQDHTYAEPINTLIIPEEDNCYTGIVSSQNMGKTQSDIADVLGLPSSKVTCKVGHLGGGFGGKQDRPTVFATACAVAAAAVKRPVKLELTRSEDMLISGGRHPFYYKYKVGYNSDGKIVAADVLLVADGGATFDVTSAVLNKALFQCNGPYTFPNFRCEGRAAKTSRVTNTAYRGFGGPQGEYVVEHMLQSISYLTGVAPEQVRLVNLNKPGDINVSGAYNQKDFRVAEENPQKCWAQLIRDTDILERAQRDRAFNKTNKFVKRAMGFCNVRNGTLFEERFMNQAMALVHVLKDGSVVVAHSGVEMGQGLHEKVRLAVTEILPVTREQVRILETSTDTCSNTQPTSASSGNDLNVAAVVECCKKILKQLQPRLDAGAPWAGACCGAYFNAEDLHASYHYNGPHDLQYDWDFYHPGPATGPTGLYCGYGSAAVEVELDVLTGDWKILQANVLEDAGNPLNPHSDLGQVEGGYVMGTGLMTQEEIAWDADAHQETDDMSKYATPSIDDVPRKLVSGLLDDMPNEVSRAFKSKACEETPTLFGSASFFALMDAVAAARADRGKTGIFKMDSPATKHNILELIYGDE